MQIHFIKTKEPGLAKIDGLMEPIVQKIFPECHPLALPAWLAAQESTRIFEKEGVIIISYLWSEQDGVEKLLSLVQFKMKWEQFAKSFNPQNRVILSVLGESIPAFLEKLFVLDEDVRVFEILFVEEENQIFIKEVSKHRGKATCKKGSERRIFSEKDLLPKDANGSSVKQDTSFASFFYKMGKLSEDELSRFLEMESDLNRLGL